MHKKCPNCRLVNHAAADACLRCRTRLAEVSCFSVPDRNSGPRAASVIRRVAVCAFAIAFSVFGFYLSLIGSAKPLDYEQKQTVKSAVGELEKAGFATEVTLLRWVSAYRATDNWLNASVEKENAYAATNFPFEIVTIYPDFFNFPADDVERAAILLHEAQHLKGAAEAEAYEFVWKNRGRLGWTKQKYGSSVVWRNIRRQTREVVPRLFVCDDREFGDCTEK